MLKALFKKQMLELNQGFFQDRKNGTVRSKAGAFVSIFLFAVLMIGVIGGIFLYLSNSLSVLITAGMSWMYFLIMGLISIALGIFGSVFNTYASLYQAKDNDLLLALPIPVRYILTVRLAGVYIMGLMYSMVVFIPALIVYYMKAELDAGKIICSLWFALLISLFVLVLSCVLGWVVAKISTKLKHKSLMTVVLSIGFMAAYYFVYFKANEMINNLIANALQTEISIKNKAYFLYATGQAAAGDVLFICIVTVVVFLILALTVWAMSRSFIAIATASDVSDKKVYTEKRVKARSVQEALLAKEMGKFLSSPNYILNCSLGTLFLIIAGAALIIKGAWIRNMLIIKMGWGADFTSVLIAGGICAVVSMNDITAPSISLEGKNLWIGQSLPVTAVQILKSKLNLHLLLTEIPALFCGICAYIACRPSFMVGMLLILVPMMYGLLCAAFGLMLNLKHPNLNWTNEVVAVKQSMNVLAVILGGWIMITVLGVGYMAVYESTSPLTFLLICFALFTLLSAIILRWLFTRGAKVFEKL